MALSLPRRSLLPFAALAGFAAALLAYRRRMVDRRAVEFHQRYG